MKQLLNILGVCLVVSISANQAGAAALSHDDITPAAAGAANAVVAGADDLSAAIYNPAGLAWQEGVQAMIGNQSNAEKFKVKFGSSSQSGVGNVTSTSVFALSWLPEAGSWGVAGSISTPYSLHGNWRGLFPEQIGKTDLRLQRYTTDAFWRVNNTLGVSLGLDIYDVSAELYSSGSSFLGSGFSRVGAHAGARWEFTPFWTLGATFRQGADVSITDSTSSTFAITLPDELTLAVAHDLADDEIRLELDVKRTNWSSLDRFDVVNAAGATTQPLATHLKDTTDVALGMTWFWRDNTQLRFGYGYLQGANDLNAYQPAVADLDGHRFSMGFGGMAIGMHLDVAVSGVYYPNADVSGAYAANYSGSYLTWMFTLTKKF